MKANKAIDKSITDFLDNEYKLYANYVLESRAIPSLIDGFKPSQRKALWTALKYNGGKKVKTSAHSGLVVANAGYHHGSASLDGAISLMAAKWKFNVPFFDGEGNFGSRLVNAPAAARYTAVKLSSNFQKYFIDQDLMEHYPLEDPEAPEPRYFLPVIPTILLNGVKGIAVGYATEIQPYSAKALKSICKAYIQGGNISKKKLKPVYDNFSGDIVAEGNQYFAEGVYKRVSSTAIHITDIPPGTEREAYIKILDKLENDSVIANYVDKCTNGQFDFVVKLKRDKAKLTHEQIIKLFKLRSKLNENLTTIDENGRLKIFDNKIDLIKHFCDWRLEQYKVRYEHYVKRDSVKLKAVQLKIRYINDVNNKKIKFKNLSKSDIVSDMKGLNYTADESRTLLAMPMYSLTSDSLASFKLIESDLIKDINEWKTIDHLDQYINELS